MEKSKSVPTILALVCLLACCGQPTKASGIFELSLTSLVDSLGRDLRDDCCAWQNATQFPSVAAAAAAAATTTSHSSNLNHQAAQQQTSCDPSKCQLIIRICVKNYQTQIEPSQCTFGELSAQVLKQTLAEPAAQDFGNSLPVQYQPLLSGGGSRRGPQQMARQPMGGLRGSPATTTNIHHQRMLSQTLAMSQSPASAPLFYTTNQQQQQQHQSSARNQQQARNSLSGQPRALRTVAFHQPISFPFNFTWPGSFSLIIDAWFESPLQQQLVAGANHHSHHQLPSSPTTTYDLYKRQLIIKHSMRGWLAVKNEWTNDVHKTDTATLAYSYRVTCQSNYYGDQCNILCRPRDDFYGHYTCSQQGNIVCLPGWQGSYCLEPICSPGCHKDQGNCSRPNECSCRYGWQGPACEQCQLYPGCVHGSCNKPLECICDEGWGGLLCNEDLNFCANHQPCKNDGICTNTFDSNGVGSYTCACPPGFGGKNCERRSNQLEQEPSVSYVVGLAAGSADTQSNNTSTVQQQQVSASTIDQQQQQPKQQIFKKSAKQQAPKYNDMKQQQQQQQFHYPLTSQMTTSAVSINQNSNGGTQLDSWVMIGWAVIMICSIILVLVFSFRTVVERATQRSHHQYYHQAQEAGHVEDVATLQNQQNLCKSRTSLNVNVVTDHKSTAYDRVFSLVGGDGHERMAGIYGSAARYCGGAESYQQVAGTSGNRFQQQSNNHQNNISSNSRRGDKVKKSPHHQKQQQQQQQQYRSQHNLHATHENNNQDSSSDAASSSSEALAPPPPYTIAQSTHSYPNLAYQTLSSHYSSAAAAASAHYLPLPAAAAAAAAAGQRAPKGGQAAAVPQHTSAISNALYGSYSTYAGIPVVAAAAPPPNRQQDGSGAGNGSNNAAAANTAATNHYLIYPVHFMAN